ncbi:MAG: class A beta-lactamase-related serine hydrolase, partial [Spirochaetaceae bacterium]
MVHTDRFDALTNHLDSIRKRYPDRPLQGNVQHPGQGIDFSYGNLTDDGTLRRFHTASIGKQLTATAIFRMIEARQLELTTPIASLLPTETLDALFTYNGVDHRGRVTVEQLLGHTSGVADYFSGIADSRAPEPGRGGEHKHHRSRRRKFTDVVIAEPDRLWTPAELLSYSRDAQQPVAPPGERFHYSDTGYVLLGMIAEAIDGTSFGRVLERRVFEPAGMT